MRRWTINVVEPSVDDLLGDEIMIPVMRSAGVNAEELRAQLRKVACRIAGREPKADNDKVCCWAMA